MGYDSPNSDPQIPDTFKGQQAPENHYVTMGDVTFQIGHNQPTLNCCQGSDLSAYYAVTDSGDVNTT